MSASPSNTPDQSERPEFTDETPEVQLTRVRSRVRDKLDAANAVVADLTATLGFIEGAEGRVNPERAREKWTLDQLRTWLSATRAPDGATLESKLEGGSLDRQVQTYAEAFAKGGGVHSNSTPRSSASRTTRRPSRGFRKASK